ncbi:hypothetical protein [Streptomyces chiangmaiensis]|uniref:DUF3105 domain-containing protein n=1 Tax=Streptomyces chiangmaiensis TaxID=766497 RepID=A0ABU7FS66_9ACTN|nr:hypothetical protein [Streptomyces chiangmaiensis]MED7826961.1 hypothetical protein [Streptomyces chiangmaiensis]
MRKWRVAARETAVLTGTLAVMLALLVWGASSAAAGGPTSVLVTSPESGEATARYFSDEEYGQLEQLLGPPDTGTRDKPPEADLVDTRQINVTWLAHDISPWRLDRVFPGSGTDAVWIHTAAHVLESPNGYWHRAEDAARLRTLLKKLGVMGRTSDTGYSGVLPMPWQSDVPATSSADVRTAPATVAAPEAGGTNWWWAITGAGAGAVLTLVLPPRRGAARPRAPQEGAGTQAGVARRLRRAPDRLPKRWCPGRGTATRQG